MRIAIITHYYRSTNYGGNLQAYALCKFLNDNGYDTEQISYCRDESTNIIKRIALRTIKEPIKVLLNAKNHIFEVGLVLRRNKAVRKFNKELIPHSREYTDTTIQESVRDYDVFITGSDQVWNPNAVTPAYRLDFVPKTKTKMSYAASIAVDSLEDKEIKVLANSLSTYTAISLRESNLIKTLEYATGKKVYQALDPTLLLSSNEWNRICSDRLISNKYIFCYFLGDDDDLRKIASEYAAKHKLKLVNIPHLLGKVRKCDINFGDIRISKVSPGDFLSLIKYAEAVFTDSFHGSVFSIEYNVPFVVFERKTKSSMGSRISTLVEMADCTTRYIKNIEECSIEHIESVLMSNDVYNLQNISRLRKESTVFLLNNLQQRG